MAIKKPRCRYLSLSPCAKPKKTSTELIKQISFQCKSKINVMEQNLLNCKNKFGIPIRDGKFFLCYFYKHYNHHQKRRRQRCLIDGWFHNHNHHQHHHLSLHSSAQPTCDKGCENNTSTPYQQQFLANLFSDYCRIDWSPWPTIVCPGEDFRIIRFSESGTVETSFISSLLVTLVSSYFHLMLVTFERLRAITFTM